MKIVKIALGVMIFGLVSCTQARKICTKSGDQTVCQQCTCSQGHAIPGVQGPACPDGSAPKCEAAQENESK